VLRINHPTELISRVGQDLGASSWRTVSQAMIDTFAGLTGDTHWIHTDPIRAAAEGPFGGTVAHGFMTLALITSSMNELLEIGGAAHFVNYGLDGVRFTGPVRASSRIRLRQTLADAAPIEGGVRVTTKCTLEVEGAKRPAVVADFIFLAFSAAKP
jgi:acyl dehydratase